MCDSHDSLSFINILATIALTAECFHITIGYGNREDFFL